MLVNLLDKEKEKEMDIITTFEKICELANNDGITNVKYMYFNYSKECQADDFTSIEKKLLVKIEKIFANFKFFHFDQEKNKIVTQQKGLFRSNCLDSLDRTNVIQTRIAYEVLKNQLKTIEINLDELTSLSNFANETFFCTEKENDTILLNFKELWGDNGDFISLQYTGTLSCKTSVTKTGKTGLLESGLVGLERFIQCNFDDKFKQECYDILLQRNINSNESYHDQSEFKELDNYLHINKKSELVNHSSEINPKGKYIYLLIYNI